MLRRFRSLYARYSAAHLAARLPGPELRDSDGQTIGYVDCVAIGRGRIQVTGWALARRVRLVMGAAEVEGTPSLARIDVASALGVPEGVGFELSLPVATLDSGQAGLRPGLVVFPREGQPAIPPVPLPARPPRRARIRVALAFLRDGARALPFVLGWRLTGDPAHRARVKSCLRLGMPLASGPLAADLFAPARDDGPARSDDPARDDGPGAKRPSPPGPAGMSPAPGPAGMSPAPGPAGMSPAPGPAGDVPPVPRPRITIVLPVYNAFDLLGECLERIGRFTDLPFSLIVIEDGSPDPRVRPFLTDRLAEMAAQGHDVTLLENTENQGFIRSVNRGLDRARAMTPPPDGTPEGPVVLLNSDAFVPAGWASRLVRPFATHDTVASVTPMSNDAEIFSVPMICRRTPLAPGQGDAIDAVARRVAPDRHLAEAPTGVGFCMALGRDWLARVPAFDTAFGRGYGEEVDWCRKVARSGGLHLGLPTLFVEHRGGESFGSAEKRALVAHNNRIVAQRHPGYDLSVQAFIAADPLATPRLALGLAWAGSLDPEAAVPVYLAHAMGGGADHWLEHRLAEDLAAGRPSVVLRVGGPARWRIELVTPQGRPHGQTDSDRVMAELLALLPRRHVVYSCGVGDRDPVSLPDRLVALMTASGDSAEILFHDFFPLSPAYTLLGRDGAYRGAPRPDAAPDPAHRARRPDGCEVDLATWQAAWKRLAARATLTVFSEASAAEVRHVWPDLANRIRVRPHALRHHVPRLPAPAPAARPVLAVLGNIGLQKGAGVLQALGRAMGTDPDGPRLVLIGNVDPAFALPPTITVHGSYAVEDLPALVAQYGVTHWLIPSIWPETFCYTVHETLATGLPVLAFGIGAQGEAVRARPNGHEIAFDPDADLAQRVRATLDRLTRPGRAPAAPARRPANEKAPS